MSLDWHARVLAPQCLARFALANKDPSACGAPAPITKQSQSNDDTNDAGRLRYRGAAQGFWPVRLVIEIFAAMHAIARYLGTFDNLWIQW